jgi:predicted ATPase
LSAISIALPTPLAGRDEEIAMLMRRWERARQGDGQLVLIVGEPGLGKSRLIGEFHLRLKETPHTWTEWTCAQLLQNTPLHPISEWGRQRFGGADVPSERRLAELENTLELVKLDPFENASLLAPLLDIPLPKERVSTLAPEELRRRQLAAVTNWIMAGAKAQPMVLVFEDLHWADPTTLDVLRSIAERGAQVPLYIVATTRPEFRPPWGMRSHHGTVSLAPLDRAQVRDMVGELSARHVRLRCPERRPPPLARMSRNSVVGSGTPLSGCVPRSSATNSPATWRCTRPATRTAPGSASACTRAAILATSP